MHYGTVTPLVRRRYTRSDDVAGPYRIPPNVPHRLHRTAHSFYRIIFLQTDPHKFAIFWHNEILKVVS